MCDLLVAQSPAELIDRARGLDLRASVAEAIADAAELGAESVSDEQLRIGVLAWSAEQAREHRARSAELLRQARELYAQAAEAEGLPRTCGASHCRCTTTGDRSAER